MRFTIGLPITKTAYLKETVDSILNQDFKDFEVIIKNNASDSIIKEDIKLICNVLKGLPNVEYLESKEQLSMPENFNSILEKASGTYFLIMSDDDVMESNFLSEFDNLINKYPSLSVFHCRVKVIDENNKLTTFYENCPDYETRMDFLFNRINYKRSIYLSDFVVNTKELMKIGGFPIGTSAWGVDEITWLKLGHNGIAYTYKVLLNYRVFKGNISYNPANMEKRFKDIEFMEREIEAIILSETENSKSIYPQEFLLELNRIRSIRQKDDVFINLTKVSKPLQSIKFFFRNKKQISKKGFFKGLARVLNISN